MAEDGYVPLDGYREYSLEEMKARAGAFRADMVRRRSVRDFSTRAVPREVIEDCILTAASAPSGANMQPWYFVAVSDASTKRRIRQAAEKDEYEFYHAEATEGWRDALSGLGTDYHKPFLEDAPYLIVVFAQSYHLSDEGEKVKHYYVRESAGIAVGMLIAAIHNAGLVTLPYTPPRTGFLNEMLGRPENERGFAVLPVGYPAEGAEVPKIVKKKLDETAAFM